MHLYIYIYMTHMALCFSNRTINQTEGNGDRRATKFGLLEVDAQPK